MFSKNFTSTFKNLNIYIIKEGFVTHGTNTN